MSQQHLLTFMKIPFAYLLFLSIMIPLIVSYDAPTGCSPFGLRLALGRTFFDQSSNESISIWFNTKLDCQKSYVTIERYSSIKKVYCDFHKISFSNYTSFVHRCSIDFLQRGQGYDYQAYGWSGDMQDPAVSFLNQNIKAYLIDGLKPIKILTLADWAYLQKKASVYNRLDDAFNFLLKSQQKPDLIKMGGDYAYDLSSNNGKNYQNFLIMLSQIASHWPCIMTPGNHEDKNPNDQMLFSSTFELYNLTNNNITMLDLGMLNIILLDPYSILYEKSGKQSLLASFKMQLQIADKSKPIIVSSHYPLACSGYNQESCRDLIQDLLEFWQLMIEYNVALYIGAHYHTYERIYPFLSNGKFINLPGPYNLSPDTKMLISIVEGIAGNDNQIVQQYPKISCYTAALSFKQTGYGILSINFGQLTYEHYVSVDPKTSVDKLQIGFEQILKKK